MLGQIEFERERDKEERDNGCLEKMSFISRMNPVTAVLRRMAGTTTTATRYYCMSRK